MGASKYKKVRAEERGSGVSPREQAKQEQEKQARKSKTLYTVIGVVLALLAIFAFIVNTSIFDTRLAVARIGDESFSAAEVRYAKQTAYSSFYNNYSSVLSYLLDPDKPLTEQECLFNSELTWDEYFTEQGLEYLKQTSALYKAAKEAGYELTAEEQETIERDIETMGSFAKAYGYTADGYVAAMYGKGNNIKSVRRMMERGYIAADFANDKNTEIYESFTDADLDAYYEEHHDSFDTVNYLYASVPVQIDEENGISEERAKELAMGVAEAIEAASDGSTDSFSEAVSANLDTEPYKSSNTIIGLGDKTEWFTAAERKEGDVFISDEDSSIRVYCYLSTENNEYNTVSVRHILVKAIDADADGVYSDEEKQLAFDSLSDIAAKWDGTEENFISLAEQYSEDEGSNTNGGLYEDIYKGMTVEQFDEFCFSGAESGETAIVYGESSSYSGYHLIYMIGEGDSYAHVLARDNMTSEEYANWENGLTEGLEIEKTGMYRYL